MVGDFGWEHEGTKSGVGTVNSNLLLVIFDSLLVNTIGAKK